MLRSSGESEGNANVLDEIFQQVPQEPATTEMINEYNKLVKYYNSLPKDQRIVEEKDAERILFIMNRMSPEQKAKAEKIKFDVSASQRPAAPKAGGDFPDVPAPPEPPVPPAPKGAGDLQPVPATPAVGAEVPSVSVPPVPPAPPKPEEHFKELAKQGATFYYGNKEISSAEAIELVKKTKNLSIHVTGADGNKRVRIEEN